MKLRRKRITLLAAIVLAVALGVGSSAAAPGPDLVPTAVTAPAAAAAGSQISLSWTVDNQGDAQAAAIIWVDRVFLSADTQIGSGDQSVASASRTQPLDAGTSYTVNVTTTLSSTLAQGTYYLLLKVDENNSVTEGNEANNVLVGPQIQITKPDLVPTALDAPATGAAGTQIALSWTAENRGDAPMPASWLDNVFLSMDTQLGVGDGQVVQHLHPDPLDPGASYTTNANGTLASNLAPGSYYLILRVDNGNSKAESDETNNVLVGPQIQVTKPDLVPTDLVAPASAAAGQPVALSWTVENHGDATAQPNWVDNVYLSDDFLFGPTDIQIAQSVHTQSLAPGGSYTLNLSPTLSGTLAAGVYYVLLRTDTGATVAESNEGNNLFVGPQITIAKADLLPLSLTGPAQAAAGSQITLAWTVENQGTATGQPTWRDQVFLSADTILTGTDTFLGTATRTLPLDPGTSYGAGTTGSVPITIAPGTYYLILHTDRDGVVPETDEANNFFVGPQIEVAKPDLVPTTLDGPTVGAAGSTIALSWTVANQGAETAQPSWFDTVWLSADQQLGGGDIAVKSVQQTQPVAAGDSYAVSTTASLADSFPGGTYYLIVRTDESSVLFESNEANNVLVGPQITITKPDLVPTSVTASPAGAAGSTIALSWTVENQGEAAAQPSWEDRLVLSLDDQIGAGDTQIVTRNHTQQLAAGESYTETVPSLTLSSGLAAGTYFVLLKTDFAGSLSESDEANNVFVGPQIVVTNPKPDLVPTALLAPTTAEQGDSISLSWTVENEGDAPAQPSWQDAVYLSADDTLGAGDIWIAAATRTQALAAGAAYTVDTSVTVPFALPSGQYHVIARADDTGSVTEGDEGDNTLLAAQQLLVDRPPTAHAGGPYSVGEGGSVDVAGSASDPDGDAVSFAWDLDGDGGFETPGQTTAFSAAGIDGPDDRSVTLRVCDVLGACATSNASVSVVNQAPAVDAGGAASLDEGGSIQRSGAFTDPGPDQWSATVDYGDGSGVQPLTLDGTSFELGHGYPDNGLYTVTVSVADDDGGVGSNSFDVTVTNVAPAVDAGADASLTTGAFSQPGSFADPGADEWQATVDYGDGSDPEPLPLVGKTFSLVHTYAAAGVYTVGVTVSDDEGATGTDSATVTVTLAVPDTTAPSISCGSTDGAWHSANVSLACTASDAGSGLADPADASFTLATTVPAGLESANAATGSHVVCDRSGNCATAGPIAGNKVDRKAPNVSIVTPAVGASYLLNQAVQASFTCADGGSGVASCSGTASVATATVGAKSFAVTAVDAVGNAAVVSAPFTVSYGVALLYNPAAPANAVKLQLVDAGGVNVSSSKIVLTAKSIDGTIPLGKTMTFVKRPPSYKYALPRNLKRGAHQLLFTAGGDPILHAAPFSTR